MSAVDRAIGMIEDDLYCSEYQQLRDAWRLLTSEEKADLFERWVGFVEKSLSDSDNQETE